MSRQHIAQAFLKPDVQATTEEIARVAGVSEADVDDFADDLGLIRTDGGFMSTDIIRRRIEAIARGERD